MKAANFAFASASRFRLAQRMGRIGFVSSPAKMDGFIACRASAHAGQCRAIFGRFPTRPSATGGRRAMQAATRRHDDRPPLRARPFSTASAQPRCLIQTAAPTYRAIIFITVHSMPPARLHLMTERLREYGAEVVESSLADLPAVIARQLQSSGRRSFVAPPGLPAEWLVAAVDWKIDQ